MNRKEIISSAAVGVVLAGSALAGLAGWYGSEKRNAQLQTELAELRKMERVSAVQKSVSRQMEMIAYEQKEISDEQREEAQLQTRIANELREHSEEERHKAVVAQQSAQASERRALEAFDQAEQQRQIAEHQRIQAEVSKRVTDTLGYLSLGRSLGSMAITQYNIGNQELANQLSYAAFHFTNKYGGNIYDPSVYQPLSLVSRSKTQWDVHQGAITNTKLLTRDGQNILTVSSYGEIQRHKKEGDQLKTKTLFFDKKYDFRNVYPDMDNSIIYALSRTGHLVILTPKSTQILELQGVINPTKMTPLGKNTLIIGENGLALFDPQQKKIIDVCHLDYRIISSGSHDHIPRLFDDKGNMYEVNSLHHIVKMKQPVQGMVSSFTASQKYQAFGMNDGTIYVMNKKGIIRKLVGHRSRISKLRFNGNSLYSSSFDGTLNMWTADSEKPEPVTLYSGNCWILHFSFDKGVNHLWVGDQKGHLSEVLVSIPIMVETVKKKLKRDFTAAEWNYYMGQNVPYESFINARKEVKP